jgi:amidase
VVGIKTTVGLTSRAGGKSCLATFPVRFTNLLLVIPISEHQDTVGPLARSVTDAAIVLSIIAGPDPNDNFTLAQPMPVPDYTMALSNTSLVGKRIGVPRAVFLNDSMTGNDPYVNQVFEQALETLKTLGATIVDPADLPSAYEIYESNNETVVLDVDFKVSDHTQAFNRFGAKTLIRQVQLNAWFDSLVANPSGVASLEDLIMFDSNNPTLEEPTGYTDQSMCVPFKSTAALTEITAV